MDRNMKKKVSKEQSEPAENSDCYLQIPSFLPFIKGTADASFPGPNIVSASEQTPRMFNVLP
jgi:hypothetical protein